uniref:Uncharacterized protein n=1 Tax=Picea sitchensis TaxID=3332 RepID=A9P0B3_PICSI|nr:unknown [Picea sitchensis]
MVLLTLVRLRTRAKWNLLLSVWWMVRYLLVDSHLIHYHGRNGQHFPRTDIWRRWRNVRLQVQLLRRRHTLMPITKRLPLKELCYSSP